MFVHTTIQQVEEQRTRWNERASTWDADIKLPNHYTNFENGYLEFLALEQKLLAGSAQLSVGLDAACGTGETSTILAQHVDRLYVLDIAEKMLQKTVEKAPNAIPLHASVTDIPLADQSVDCVVSRGIVVSHLPRILVLNFFIEMGRLVRLGGFVLFDFLSNINSAEFSNVSPKIPFSDVTIADLLKGHGFSNITFYGSPADRVRRVYAVRTSQ
jgi:ubiquinone/menaquinone biosynthesis C-methylase UbiE